MPATSTTPSPLEAECLCRRDCEMPVHHCTSCLIGQIKLTRIHVLPVFLPGVRVKRDSGASLYNVERSGHGAFAGTTQPNFVSLLLRRSVCQGVSAITGLHQKNGGARRDRTDDILLAKQALSQLSYGPISWKTNFS